MDSRLSLGIVVLVSVCCFSYISADYPCPQPGPSGLPAFSDSQQFAPQSDSQVQWHYVTGALCIGTQPPQPQNDGSTNDCRTLGFQLTTLLYNVSGGSSASATNFLVSSSMVSISYGDKHYAFAALGLPPIYPNPQQPFDLTFLTDPAEASIQYSVVHGDAGQDGSVYNFVAVTPNATIDLILRSETPLMLEGSNGYAGIAAAPFCVANYYVSIPHLSTSGVVRLNDDILFVSGVSWFDHEWGSDTSIYPGSAWVWLGIHLSDGGNLMISIPLSYSTILYPYSYANLFYPNGTGLAGIVTSVEFISNWTSPLTGFIYPTELRIFTSLSHVSQFKIHPIFQNQELYGLLPNEQQQYLWEGPVKVQEENSNSHHQHRLTGEGYLELVGFTA